MRDPPLPSFSPNLGQEPLEDPVLGPKDRQEKSKAGVPLDRGIARTDRSTGEDSITLTRYTRLDYAKDLTDLASPPGNRLEALKGDLARLHSIRINARWRVVFRWTELGPADVEIRDYH
jgi:plasmid maintenance system killer protein